MTEATEFQIQLEDIAYFAGQADSVSDLRKLDLLLKATLTLKAQASDAADATD